MPVAWRDPTRVNQPCAPRCASLRGPCAPVVAAQSAAPSVAARGAAPAMSRPPAQAQTFKVVLLGEGRVGKTSLLLRYVTNVFSDTQPATIQASYLTKRITVDGATLNLAIWDTAGQERFHALGPIYYRDADAALLVFDITDVDSFNRVKSWVKELRQMAGKDIALVLAGNKVDMERSRQVPAEEADAYATSIGATLFGTSAKLNRGVEQAFLAIARKLIEQHKGAPQPAGVAHGAAAYRPRAGIVVLQGNEGDTKAKAPVASACC